MNKKMLRKKLAMMLATLKKKRKFFCEVEYLEGTGTQYIDTGILPSEDLRTKVVQAYTGTSIAKNSSIFGSNGNGNLRYWINYDNRFEVGYGNFLGTNVVVQPNELNTIDFNYIKNGSHYFSFNGREYTSSGTPNTQYSIILFGRVFMNNAPVLAPQRIYNVQFIRNDVLIGDFIPVLDWNMTPCMYDRVTEQLFYNAGTGDFIAGREIHPVEYLESTGTQWIDTGVNPENANTQQLDIETDFAVLTPGSDQYIGIFGAAVPRFGFYTRYNDMCFGYSAAFDNLNEIEYGKKYSLKFSVTKGSQNATLDGVNVWSATRNEALQNTYTIGLFCRNYSTPQWRNNARIYNLKIVIGGTLVRDFIPAISEDGTAFMFDRVTHTCFLNQGTGAFKYPAREVEYLEGTGKQYIDTGVRGFADFEIGVKLRESVSNVSIFCGNGYRLERYNASNPYWRFRNNNDFYNSGVPITEYHVMAWKNDEVYSDGVKLQDFAKTWNVSANMTLFGASASGSYPSMIYFCKLWNPDNGTLLRDFVPAYKDGLVGLYDKVNDVLYQNIGSGNFLTGKIVEPEYE